MKWPNIYNNHLLKLFKNRKQVKSLGLKSAHHTK